MDKMLNAQHLGTQDGFGETIMDPLMELEDSMESFVQGKKKQFSVVKHLGYNEMFWVCH